MWIFLYTLSLILCMYIIWGRYVKMYIQQIHKEFFWNCSIKKIWPKIFFFWSLAQTTNSKAKYIVIFSLGNKVWSGKQDFPLLSLWSIKINLTYFHFTKQHQFPMVNLQVKAISWLQTLELRDSYLDSKKIEQLSPNLIKLNQTNWNLKLT